MKILYVADYQGDAVIRARHISGNVHDGANTKISRIARGLTSRGHNVSILATGIAARRSGRLSAGFDSTVDGTAIPVSYGGSIDIPVLNHLVAATCMLRWARRSGPWDCILMYNFAFEPVATCLSLCRTSHVPLVVEYEDDAKISLDGENRLHKYKGECAIGCLQKYIGGAVVVTEQLSSHLRSPNVLVLPGLVEDVQEGLPSRSASRRPIIVYSGGMNYLKGPDILLDALQYIQQEIEVHFFGGGPMLDVLREQAERVPKHSVNIHGRVPESVLQAYLSQASVFVNPHRMALGHGKSLFPFKVFEYLAAARPVVTSQISEVSPAMEGGLVRYNEDSPEALAEALNLCLSTYSKWSAQALLAAAEVKSQYSVSAVAERIEKVLLAA